MNGETTNDIDETDETAATMKVEVAGEAAEEKAE